MLIVTAPDRGPRWSRPTWRIPALFGCCARLPIRAWGLVSRPRRLSFRSAGRTAHAWYYSPTNPDVQPLAGERPPLLIFVHGGPTSAADPCRRLQAVLDHAGIRHRRFGLCRQHGPGARLPAIARRPVGRGRSRRHLCTGRPPRREGLADPARLAVRGGSAGGFTVLAVLARRDTFTAGVSYFGVSDLAAFARDTHKFESRYLDRLVGPCPLRSMSLRGRCPIWRARPPLLLQGLDDEVVPPAQSEAIVDALAERGIPHAYLSFEGEGHGRPVGGEPLRCLTRSCPSWPGLRVQGHRRHGAGHPGHRIGQRQR